MKTEYRHKVLVVDDEPSVLKAIRRTLRPLDVEIDYSEDGNTALEKIKSSVNPYSLVITDQRMPGMRGTELLARSKEISPDTVRILITGYSSMDTIIDAVNKGAVHRYISKPWDLNEFLGTIKKGLGEYETIFNLQNLSSVAKAQNSQLYALNQQLREKTAIEKQKLAALDREINELKSLLGTAETKPDYSPDRLAQEIVSHMEATGNNTDDLDRVYTAASDHLLFLFNDLAMRNGFEMPEIDFRGGNGAEA